MQFHLILKNLREQNNMTLKDLSSKMNISIPALSNYENNRRTPNIDIIVKLANFFDVPLEYLLTGKEKKPENINTEKKGDVNTINNTFTKNTLRLAIILNSLPKNELSKLITILQDISNMKSFIPTNIDFSDFPPQALKELENFMMQLKNKY